MSYWELMEKELMKECDTRFKDHAEEGAKLYQFQKDKFVHDAQISSIKERIKEIQTEKEDGEWLCPNSIIAEVLEIIETEHNTSYMKEGDKE